MNNKHTLTKSKRIIKKKNRVSTTKDFPFISTEIDLAGGRFQKEARKTYLNLPFPTLKDEPWRRTDIRKLHPERFSLAASNSNKPKSGTLPAQIPEIQDAVKLFFSQDFLSKINDEVLENTGIIFDRIEDVSPDQVPDIEKIPGSVICSRANKFAALSSAYSKNTLLLYVPKNTVLKTPLQSTFFANGSLSANFSHLIIWLEESSEITLLHQFISDNKELFHAGNLEIHVGPNAKLSLIEMQTFGERTWNFTTEKAVVERDAQINWVYSALGSGFSKNFIDIDLVGEGAVGNVSGIHLSNKQQHLDLDTQQNHLMKNTTSNLLFKGTASNKSRTVWQGMIYVSPEADKTDGYQSNRNILLDPEARIDTIPGLEIKANNVRCSHGATAGKLDEEQIYYLMTRGLSRKDAEEIILKGFFQEVIDLIPIMEVQRFISKYIVRKIYE